MRRFRYSIASLLGLVLLSAVAVAALRQADDHWDSGMFTLSIGLLLTSVLLAIHRTGQSRAFWLGFALCGSGYLIASLIPPVESRLLTTKGLAYLDSTVSGRDSAVRLGLRLLSRNQANPVVGYAFSPDGRTISANQQGTVRIWNATTGSLMAGPNSTSENLIRIGHSLLALLLAFCGGRFSLWMFNTTKRSTNGENHEQRPGP